MNVLPRPRAVASIFAVFAVFAFALLTISGEPAWGAEPRLQGYSLVTIELPESGGLASRLIPPEADLGESQPLIVFLHGAGGLPRHYESSIKLAAVNTATPVIMPVASSPLGWGFGNDFERIFEAIEIMRQTIDVDPERISIAGHSAGGGMALLVGLAPGSIFNGIFQLSSPFVQVGTTPVGFTPQLRQYYGVNDINYNNAFPSLQQQWQDLGLEVENQIELGYGHGDWPIGTFEDGFEFLLDQVRPEETLPGYEEPIEPPQPSNCGDAFTLCLVNDQFEVSAQFTVDGDTKKAKVVDARTDDSGLFWFFGPDNWEILIKMIDGCNVNGNFWVYSAATTDVAYTLTVRNRVTEEVKAYTNIAGERAPAVTDGRAFPCQ